MSFKPSEITKEHILRGIRDIEDSNVILTEGTKWEVIINGKSYPPKEVMRFARKQYDGSDDWPRGGGWRTNNFLEKMGFEVIAIGSTIAKESLSVPYFKITEIWKYQKVSDTKYDSSTKEAEWYYDTRQKLYYLITLIGESLNEEFKLVYSEQPNAQKGRGKIFFKDYVLAGFAPKEKNIGDHLFIKISFTNLKLKPLFAVDMDMNFKKGKSKFHGKRKQIYSNSLKEWEINDAFPDNWHDLLTQIIPTIKNLNEEFKKMIESNDTSKNTQTKPLNQILYGPPGTGKTFNTINKAISIANPSFDLTVDRDIVKKEYDRLVDLGHIVFTTFHQSMSYEEFIEGIKPETTPSGNVIYNVKDGIFKELCDDAKSNIDRNEITSKNSFITSKEFDKQLFYKLSLGNSNDNNDREIYEYCIENKCIALGYGGTIDFAGKDTKEIYKSWQAAHNEDSTTPSYVNYFVNIIHQGDYVIISNGNRKIRAMAKVTGDYFIDLEAPIRYKHFRNVEWIFHDQEFLSSEVYELNLSQSTLYQLKKEKLKKDFFTQNDIQSQKLVNYVLIIDEINRGNISQIFGELITLIEADKRLGKNEELKVTLPYSNNKFGVPSNLFIIGTMNTADRSVEALDTALRRRFCFEEMLPDLEVLNGKEISGIDLKELLSTINKRVEILLDRDHTIGHSYFINIKSENELKNTFKNNIIPLLQEYFYGDYEKIGMIIGDAFFEDIEKYDKNVFANFPSLNYPETGSILRIKIINKSFDIVEALKVLLKK